MSHEKKHNPSGHMPETATQESTKALSPSGVYRFVTVAIAFVLSVAAVIAIPLGIRAWIENQIDNDVDAKVRSVLSDQTILRKIAAESHPSLIFDASGAILQDMGAVQYIKPDDIKVSSWNYAGNVMPAKLHIGFNHSVSFAPIVTSLRDPAAIIASHGKGLDWEFDINWTVAGGDEPTNGASYVFRLEVVP